MHTIFSKYTASITELKRSPAKVLEKAGDETVAILSHNVPSAYLVPSKEYEKLMEIVDDYYLAKDVAQRLNDGEEPVKVNIDEL